jgi:spermidine synthase
MVYALFFLSGAAALAYEASWSRLVGLALGNTAAAAALVIAACFAGFAIGHMLGGHLLTRVQPLLGYGVAEIFAAAWAAVIPTLLAPAGTPGEIFPNASPAARAAWCFAVLLPVTVALGSTLPFIAAHLSRRGDNRLLSLAYALNTAGGVVGLLGTTVVLLVAVGVRASGYLAAGVSAACGLAACLLAACQVNRPGPPVQSTTPDEPTNIPPLWWAVAIVSGFGTLGLEVLYTRLFALVFHNSSYTFGAVVAVFLAGLALGAALVAAIGPRVSPRTTVVLSASLGAAAVASSVVLFVRQTGLNYFAAGDTFTEYLANALGLVAAVVLPPAVILGMALPTAFVGAGGTGRVVGRLAAVNTAAAVAGALAAGFVLPSWVGLWESFGLFVLLFGTAGAAILYARGRVSAAAGVGLLTAVATTVAASGQALVSPPPGEEVVRRWNTAYGWIDVVRNTKDDSLTVRQNLHYRHGSTGKTAAREYRQGRLPLLLHPKPTAVAFIGIGTGLSSAPLVPDQDVEWAVVVELIPEVVEAARFLSAANLGVVDHPKVEVRVDDARHHLARTDRRFDVVVSDLFVPWESRTGYLYTVDFYQTVRSRLKPGGLFCQWLALYQVGPAEFELIADSFAAAFPNVTLWWGQFDRRFPIVALVGSDNPLELDPARLAGRWTAAGESPAGADPELQSWADLPELFLGSWPARPGRALNTDEHPRLEFSAPVSQQSGRALQGEALRSYFDRMLANLPADGVDSAKWPAADWEPGRRRARQRMNLFGP